MSEPTKNDYRGQARAAIEAMRKPTEEMLQEVEEPYDDGISKYRCRDVWTVMIDAALNAPADASLETALS